MFKGSWLQHALNVSLCIIAFAIPFPYIYSSLAVVLFCIIWLLQLNFKTLIDNFKTRKMLWLWLLFFIFHLISYTYSTDKQEAVFDLQKKLSFLIFPVVIGAGICIDKKILERIFLFFTIGVTLIAVFCITRALIVYHYTGATVQFFYHPLIKGLTANAVYQSLYVLFSITILLFFEWGKKYSGIFKILFLAIQITFFILLSSRTLIIIFFIVVLPIYIKSSFANIHRSYMYSIILIMFYLLLCLVIFKTDNPVKKRYLEITNHSEKIIWSDVKNNKESEFNNLSLRLFLWKVGYHNMKEHNLWLKGGGNGSVYMLQNSKMAEYGVKDIYNEKNRSPLYNINLHNMYLQVLLMLGIPGLLLLLLIVFSPLMYIRRFDYKSILFIFNFSILMLMLQEASLQTQAGIVFYTYFCMVFYNYYCTQKSATPKQEVGI